MCARLKSSLWDKSTLPFSCRICQETEPAHFSPTQMDVTWDPAWTCPRAPVWNLIQAWDDSQQIELTTSRYFVMKKSSNQRVTERQLMNLELTSSLYWVLNFLCLETSFPLWPSWWQRTVSYSADGGLKEEGRNPLLCQNSVCFLVDPHPFPRLQSGLL